MRHGKSSWDFSVSDRDRPLEERGISDAHLIASELENLNIKIEASYSSPANRALHTAMIVLRALNFPFSKFHISNDLYDFSGESVVQFVKDLDDKIETVLIFGHNHAFTQIVNAFGNSYIENVPTAGLVQLNFEVDKWSDINNGITKKSLFPKQLK
tara:strand:+ start:214524 stop:214991 length:468 start_codon:yes stop_codon:yes gene_type:complete